MFEWLDIDKFLTVELGRSLLTALFGAGLGAWAAQRIAAKIREREERLRTVRAANAAVTLAYAITDSLLGFKHQLVKPTVDTFMLERQRVIEDTVSAKNRPPGSFRGAVVIGTLADMREFSAVWTPIKDLQEIVFKQISPPFRPVWVMGVLTAILSVLEQQTTQRNELIAEFRKASSEGKDISANFYGLEAKPVTDQRYLHVIENIGDKVDDAIYFSKLIGDDLRRYTAALRATLPEAAKPFSPVIISADFSRRADVMPDSTQYKDYDQMFQEVRALGVGIWSAKFEALAMAQYQTDSLFYVM